MILTLSLPGHQSVGLLAQDCLGILRRRFDCVVERMRCMPFNERASFIELSMLGLPLKWKYESGRECGPGLMVANISLSWKTLYQQLWDSWAFRWWILWKALCFMRKPLQGWGLGGKGMMVGLSPRNLSSSSSEPRLQPSSAHRRERFKRRGCERVISCDQIGR